jgi:hypothetical protein
MPNSEQNDERIATQLKPHQGTTAGIKKKTNNSKPETGNVQPFLIFAAMTHLLRLRRIRWVTS